MTKITVTYERESKIPEWATPKVLRGMREDGMTLRQIAKVVGVSHETIRLILKAEL